MRRTDTPAALDPARGHRARARPAAGLAATLGALLALLAAWLPSACRTADEHPDEGNGEARARAHAATLREEALAERLRPDLGAELFGQHCAVCHGTDGRGARSDAPGAPLLFPPPRDFGSGQFRLVSAENGVPSEADIVRTLQRGMPGSAMPSWAWLPEEWLGELAGHVRLLAVRGLTDDLRADGLGAMNRVEAAELALDRLEPGPPVETGRPAHVTPEVLARGRALFGRHCARCHGEDGRGKKRPPEWTERGELSWSRDFTAGILKGGSSHDELARRVLLGMPGSDMPPTRFDDPADLAALVAFVQDLIPAGSESRLVMERRHVRVHRVLGALPTDPDDPAWRTAEQEVIVLAPMRWRDDAVTSATVSALHDGERIALRVGWDDPTGPKDPLLGGTVGSDALAVQLSTDRAPPLFGMGSHATPTQLWHWRARRPSDTSGLLDLVEQPPHVAGDPPLDEVRLDAPVYVPTRELPESARSAEPLTATGPGDLAPAELAGGVTAVPRWRDGRWEVVLVRALVPREAGRAAKGRVELPPGSAAHLALAIWDGDAGDRGGQKSITIWHRLEIGR